MNISKSEINKAGDLLSRLDSNILDEVKAEEIVNNWRSLHVVPLNAVVMNLRHNAKKVDPKVIIAQRLKRIQSIKFKLVNNDKMQLARMQDIAGCRAILSSVEMVYDLANRMSTRRNGKKIKIIKDYIQYPKDSGYRGIHLLAKYSSKRNSNCEGLMVEIQLRTKIQHIWATGVETVGAIINSPLKSNIGPDDWKDFFATAGEALAKMENPSTKDSNIAEIASRLREINNRIDAQNTILRYGHVINHLDEHNKDKRHKSFLIHFKPVERKVELRGYLGEEYAMALKDYSTWEKAANAVLGENVVLVNVDSIVNLKKAYPNYFGDTKELSRYIQIIIAKAK